MSETLRRLILIGFLLFVRIAFAYPPPGPMTEGAMAWVQGDIETAKKAFIAATEGPTTRVNAWYNLGYLHLWSGRSDSAKILMTRALELNPDFAPAHFELGKMAMEEGKVITANEHFEKAVRLRYALFRAWHLLGETRLILGDTAGARDAFAKSLDNHAGYHLALESLAQLSLAVGDTLSARSFLNKACHESPAPSAFRKYLTLLDELGETRHADSIRSIYQKWFPDQPTTTKSIVKTNPLFPIGERLEYSFRWEFVKLGSAILTITGWDSLRGNQLLRLHIDVQSAPMIIVVNVQDQYDAWIDPVTGICHRFRFHMNSYGVDLIGVWDYQYSDQQYVSRTVVDEGYIYGIKQRLPAKVTDGASLLYHFRYLTKNGVKEPILFVLDDEFKSGELYPKDQKRTYNTENQPLKTYLHQGILNCRGIVGLSGYFDAWFSKVPKPLLVRAEAKIFLGSIKIALVEFTP